jgi:hypothetical protein
MGADQNARPLMRSRSQLSSKNPQSAGLDLLPGFQSGLVPFIVITGQWSQKQAVKMFKR